MNSINRKSNRTLLVSLSLPYLLPHLTEVTAALISDVLFCFCVWYIYLIQMEPQEVFMGGAAWPLIQD